MSDIAADSARIAEVALRRGLTIVVAESFTGGALAQAFAHAPDAGAWFAGGVVAVTRDAKQRALGVPVGPVVSAPVARMMAEGARELVGADIAVAVTGVGGPGDEEGRPQGTVYLAVVSHDATRVSEFAFEGEPSSVVEQTVAAALRALRADLG